MWIVHIHAHECEEHAISSIAEFGSIADHALSANPPVAVASSQRLKLELAALP